MDLGNSYEEAKRIRDWPTDELIKMAVNEPDEEKSQAAVMALQFRGTKEVLEAARQLCQSKNPAEREPGAYILGQLGVPERTFPEECVTTLLDMLKIEQDTNVLEAIGIALGHLKDPRAVEPLAKLKSHPNADVRFGVVCGLLAQEDTLAIQTLIELSSDEDDEVRNWATFGLGSMLEVDTPEIRNALFARINDPVLEIQDEAFIGLGRRKDERVIEPLIKILTSDNVAAMNVEAARDFADSRLYLALLQLKEWWTDDAELLEEALANCKPATLPAQ